jgi:N6-L-threonylcarbamoyladenine synthase
MLTLGIETSCDETGIALYHSERGLLAHALHTQMAMHEEYGGVVPELASRDHIRRVLPLIRRVMHQAGAALADIDAVAYTQGPGLAGALLVGTSVANALAFALGIPALGIHHLEGHLLSPLLASNPPRFPFVALLVSGGHTQLMRVAAVGEYELLGETVDDAAGEAFDKTAHLLGLGYPGGPALAQLAGRGRAGKYKLPRPMLEQMHKTGNLDFSFSGLKTAVMMLVRQKRAAEGQPDEADKADIAASFQEAIVDVLVAKSLYALEQTGLDQLVVAGGVGANRRLRERLVREAVRDGYAVFYPEFEFCTDNGAMIALAGALRLGAGFRKDTSGSLRRGAAIGANPPEALPMQGPGSPTQDSAARTYAFTVKPRWDLATVVS